MTLGYRIGEQNYVLLNPLPHDSEAEIFKAAKQPQLPRQGVCAFTVEYQYSTGPESQRITIQPGDSIEIPYSIGKQVYRDLREQGIVFLGPEADEMETLNATVIALTQAQTFYHIRGGEAILKWKQRKQIKDKEDEDTMRHHFMGAYVNRAKAASIEKQLVKLRADLQKAMGERANGEDV